MIEIPLCRIKLTCEETNITMQSNTIPRFVLSPFKLSDILNLFHQYEE